MNDFNSTILVAKISGEKVFVVWAFTAQLLTKVMSLVCRNAFDHDSYFPRFLGLASYNFGLPFLFTLILCSALFWVSSNLFMLLCITNQPRLS